MKFRVRVDDITPDVAERWKKLLKGYTHVLVSHVLPHGNPHHHAYVDMPDKTSCPALRYLIDKEFGVSKAERSVKKCDDDRVDDYVQYLFNQKHDNKWVLVSHTFDVHIHVEKAKAVATAFEKTRSKARSVVSEWDMAMELNNAIENDQPNEAGIVDLAIKIRLRHHKMFNDMILVRMIQTATAEHPQWSKYLKNKVHGRLWNISG